MAPNYKGVRLVDSDGNQYTFECSMDVNSSVVEDVLLSTQQGITKLVGYKLALDGIFKDMEDQIVEPQTKYNFYKKINIFDEGQTVSQEEFGETMKDLIAKAKVSRIAKVKVVSWKGEPVLEDKRGYYLKRSMKCAANACSNRVEGTIRLSTDPEGTITRGQNFMPSDSRSTRARAGSKLWMCPSCSVVSIPVPQVLQADPIESTSAVDEAKVVAAPKEEKAPKTPKVSKDRLLAKLAKLSDVDCEVPAEYLKGYLSASLEILRGE